MLLANCDASSLIGLRLFFFIGIGCGIFAHSRAVVGGGSDKMVGIYEMKDLLNKLEQQIGNVSIGLRTDQNVLAAQVSAIEAKLEQSQQHIGWLFHTEQNQNNNWNIADCHNELAVNPKRKSVQRRATNAGWRSCRAKVMMPRHFGLFYFEVEIMHMGSGIVIGLVPMDAPMDEDISYHNGTYAYGGYYGKFWGHTVEGASQWSNGRPFISEKPSFGAGDIVGVGVNLGTRQIIYTKNGRRLDTTNLYVHSIDLFPAVSLHDSPDTVEANFGPDFLYDLQKEYADDANANGA